METLTSFKGYGKVDPVQEQEFQRKTRRRCVVLIVSSLILTLVIIGAVIGTVIHKRNSGSDDPDSVPAGTVTPLKTVCSVTEHPDSCYSSIASLKSSSNVTDPKDFFRLSLTVAMDEISKLVGYPSRLIATTNDTGVRLALGECETLFDDAVDRLNDTILSMDDSGSAGKIVNSSKIDDLKTWLSATITDQETCLQWGGWSPPWAHGGSATACLDGLRDYNSTLVEEIEKTMQNATIFASNSLAIAAKILEVLADFKLPVHRKLLGAGSELFPEWVRSGDRRLLQAANPAPTVIVAKDGTGRFRTIKEAVALIGKKSATRFIIYVKAGVYEENIVLDKSKWNVMIYGDGKSRTIVSGKLNFVDGTPTFSTATFAAVGKNFIAKDIGFRNTAGPAKHQAVAFRSGSDFSVFYRCSFDAFQDTLYPHSNRQFYRDCDITGTVDFIFGNAAAVFQNCNIMPRQPLANQFNTITAQGKKDPNQNTGISIHKCTLFPFGALTVPTYLGRPWKAYSTTIVMQSSIGAFLNPLGWIEWVRGTAPPSTIFYGEYMNTGPGSSVTGRVKWSGYKPALTKTVAAKYTVGVFIEGNTWLPAANVVFDSSLL